jgi:hypothetical protein
LERDYRDGTVSFSLFANDSQRASWKKFESRYFAARGRNPSHFFMKPIVKLFAFFLAVSLAALQAEDRIQFNRDVRPILSDTCFHCHGFDPKARKAGLRLDLREAAIQETSDGVIPIVPGNPDASAIIQRIFSTDEDVVMPPSEVHKALTRNQKETLRRWVAEGAMYESHWAYTKLIKPPVPQNGNPHPVDAFIRDKLDSKKITPSPEAPKAKLLRRLFLDLIGLPPSPEEVAMFLNAKDGAYERQIDRLLESPHYGERMAVWWLDLARFADTVGYHGDQNQRIFPYRDYVIRSFNTNKSFDQFTIEQLAGDLLPNPTTDQLVATGYNRLTMMTREGGAQPKEYLAKYGAERVRAVGAAWFGSTFGCAECHDHKFDPITTRDFYEMQSFFADIKQWGSYYYRYTDEPELLGLSVNHPFPPEIEVESQYLMARKIDVERELTTHLASFRSALQNDPSMIQQFEQWIAESRDFLLREPTGWSLPTASAVIYKSDKPVKDGNVAIGPQQAVELKRTLSRAEELRVTLKPGKERIAALRVEIISDDRSPQSRTEARKQEGMRLSASVVAMDGKERKLKVYFAEADAKEPRFFNGSEILGVADGWKMPPEKPERLPSSVWLLESPMTLTPDEQLVVTLSGDPVLAVRIALSPFAAQDPLQVVNSEWRAALAAEPPSAKQQAILADSWLISTGANPSAFSKFKQLSAKLRQYHNGRAWTMVTEATHPLTVRVLPRGNWLDETGPTVLPATPSFLPGRLESKSGEGRLSRLDLAKYIVSDINPITARAVMNRLWAQFFGTGLSSTLDDLGSQGELPSHPELLDFLAAEFRDSGWDIKHMIRLLVTSATYRQSSSLRPDLRETDPANRLLASQNPRRLEAEFIRDNALFIAGLLNTRDIGGPSVHPYQPVGYYEPLTVPERDYVNSLGVEQWRRGVYMHWQRTFLHPMLANFDAPARDECAAGRIVSNTPQQSLTLLNDPTFVEAARVFATRLFIPTKSASDDERIEYAFLLAVARSPKPQEVGSLKKFLASQREQFSAYPVAAEKLLHVGQAPSPINDPVELASWTNLCRVLLNSQEVITRY